MKDVYNAISYLKNTYERGSNVPIEAVQSQVDERGRQLFRHQKGDHEINSEELFEKIQNIAKRLQEKGYPVTLDTFQNQNVESVHVALVNPDNDHHFVPLFGFFMWKGSKVKMSKLHERALGTESVLEEAFR